MRALGEVEALESLAIDPVHYLVVPRVIGLSLPQARARLRARGLVPGVARFADGHAARVLAQVPVAGVAAAPGMQVKLVVGHG